ncbi:MAG: glycosyltransferase [bacterium]|nr:glycosyltransferase [bacterium]
MKLIYLTAKQYPGNTADHHYVRKLAYAFQGKLGKDFTFTTVNTAKDALPELFSTSIYVPFFFKKTSVFFFWLPWFYLRNIRPKKCPGEPVVFFCNDFNLLATLIFWRTVFLRINICADWHLVSRTWKDRFIARYVDYSSTTSKKLESAIRTFSPTGNQHTVYGGVDLAPYEEKVDKEKVREELNLPKDKFLAGYIGLFKTMGMEKGISTMISALTHLPADYIMVFVGGRPDEIKFYEEFAVSNRVFDRCIFRPFQDFKGVVKYEKAMDALIIPYPDKPHFREYGFPMKIYEYMASGVPVVYTKLDLLEEVVGNCAFGIAPDSPSELASALKRILANRKEAEILAEKARVKVREYTWEMRAQNILERFGIMPTMLNIPNNALKYILFQRTDFSVYTSRPRLLRIVMNKRVPIYNVAVKLEAALFPGRTKKLFSLDMEREYLIIKKYLPLDPKNILDIGCGVGGIDIMFNKHYAQMGVSPHLHLLDKSEVNSKVYYGIEKEAAYYNSLETAKRLLNANGVKEENIYTQEVSGPSFFPGKKFDLIISLISWGFHYPISTYLEEAYGALSNGGTMIVDVRKGTDGEKLLEEKFGEIDTIFEGKKHKRILAHKR